MNISTNHTIKNAPNSSRFIRFNPDSYKVNRTKLNPNLSSRLKELNEYIQIV